jgi:hypothetical protein
MAKNKPVKKAAQKTAKSSTGTRKAFKGFTDEERAAMREHVQELKAAERRGPGKAGDEDAVLAKIATMQAPDRASSSSSEILSLSRR